MANLRVEIYKTPTARWAWRMLSHAGREVARSSIDYGQRSDAIDELSWLVTEIAVFAGVDAYEGDALDPPARAAIN